MFCALLSALCGKTCSGGLCVYVSKQYKNLVLVASHCSCLVKFVTVRCMQIILFILGIHHCPFNESVHFNLVLLNIYQHVDFAIRKAIILDLLNDVVARNTIHPP